MVRRWVRPTTAGRDHRRSCTSSTAASACSDAGAPSRRSADAGQYAHDMTTGRRLAAGLAVSGLLWLASGIGAAAAPPPGPPFPDPVFDQAVYDYAGAFSEGTTRSVEM